MSSISTGRQTSVSGAALHLTLEGRARQMSTVSNQQLRALTHYFSLSLGFTPQHENIVQKNKTKKKRWPSYHCVTGINDLPCWIELAVCIFRCKMKQSSNKSSSATKFRLQSINWESLLGWSCNELHIKKTKQQDGETDSIRVCVGVRACVCACIHVNLYPSPPTTSCPFYFVFVVAATREVFAKPHPSFCEAHASVLGCRALHARNTKLHLFTVNRARFQFSQWLVKWKKNSKRRSHCVFIFGIVLALKLLLKLSPAIPKGKREKRKPVAGLIPDLGTVLLRQCQFLPGTVASFHSPKTCVLSALRTC